MVTVLVMISVDKWLKIFRALVRRQCGGFPSFARLPLVAQNDLSERITHPLIPT